jgi:UDP-galactopyranose mutase
MFENFDYIIVGSGFFGAVIAERIANDLQKKVLVIEKNSHVGGNCYSEIEPNTGIEYHKYGTHIFHTSNKEVYDYLKRFCEFNGYYHQVLTTHREQVYQMPINLETINNYFHTNLKPYQVEEFLEKKIKGEKINNPSSFEEFAINSIGRELYDAFIKGYTQKQWGKAPHLLPASIIKRLPVRKNYNESYFFDTWQGIPKNGYTDIFKKLLSSRNIKILLNTNYFDIKAQIPSNTKLIYSGPIDTFFDYCYGKLEWRSLGFENEVVHVNDYQGTSVMNFADIEIPYTRIHEPKHLHPEREVFSLNSTLIIKEYPRHDNNNPYYPVSDKYNDDLLKQYQAKLTTSENVIIGGRLGDYKYYDIHHTIEKALDIYKNKIKNGQN